MQALVVFSHLRWDFVYQRPQHLMTRLAKHYRVFFIEEPVPADQGSYWEITTPAPEVLVCRPHSAVAAAGFHDDQLAVLQPLLADLVAQHGLSGALVWFYTPMALPLLTLLNPSAVIYDCMDELSAFKNAPRQVLQREHALLKRADVVFTGGPSLHAAKRSRHQNVHCFSSSVDAAHFSVARHAVNDSDSQRPLPGPRLGFTGVIDERLDCRLLESLALAQPRWQLMMVGPVVKIDPASLPRQPNIHYLGQQSYADLPRFMAGWDVCLLPFALNDATRFISPTKILEYMAAEKPIVSTAVTDVVVPHGRSVYIGDHVTFAAQCARALDESPTDRLRRVTLMRETLAGTSWDQTAREMYALIEACISRKPERASPAAAVAAQITPPVPLCMVRETPSVIIIGAGPTGLSAAYHLGKDALLLERNSTVGGWCRSVEDNGFTFDYAGHIMFSNDPYVLDLYEKLLADNVHWQDREAWIHSKDVYTRYPFQGALYGLPADVVAECIIGAIEARVGPLAELGKQPAMAVAASGPRNFEEFIYQVWGSGIAKHFAIPYNRKLWAVPLSSMETSWLGGRVPIPDLADIIEGAVRPVAKPMGPNARFGYPLRGGFQALMNGFLPLLKGQLLLNTAVTRVIPSKHQLVLGDGSVQRYEQLISTMPLPELVNSVGEEAPLSVRTAADGLRHVSVRCVNLGIDRAHVTEKHWIYYPESSVFHRIFVQGNASPHCNPAGGFGLTCEITYSPAKPLPCDGDALIDRCIEDCIAVGIITADDKVIARNQVDMPYAYVVYDHGRAANVATIRAWATTQDIILAGRYSEWEYYNSDHAFLAGRNAAATASAAQRATGTPVPTPTGSPPIPEVAHVAT